MAIQARLYQDNLGFGLGLPLGPCQDLAGDNGNGCCGGFNDLFFNLPQKQQQRQEELLMFQNQYQQQLLQQRAFGYNGVLDSELMKNTTTRNTNCSVNNLYLEKQRREIDEYVMLQNERFRAAIEEQRKQQLAAVVNEIELKALVLLAQKDREIALAAKRTAELENFVAKLEVENQTWQRVARENEATVVSLNNSLEQLLDRGYCTTTADDAGSCCGGDAAETEHQNVEETEWNRMRCRRCDSGKACMVFLPCRHLCSCQACDGFLDSCPVCQTVKKASIEALIF